MSTTQATTKSWLRLTKASATKTFEAARGNLNNAVGYVWTTPPTQTSGIKCNSAAFLARRPDWQDREYREAYATEAINQGIAWQIKLNRERRNLSQKQLAELLGTKQSAVSRLEDPDYGNHSIETLKAVARVFDCALLVKLVSYSTLDEDSQHLSEDEQYAAPYEEEVSQ